MAAEPLIRGSALFRCVSIRSPSKSPLYRPTTVDELSIRDFLKEFVQNVVSWVDQLNSAMNRGAAAARLAIGSEDENAAIDPNELNRMVRFAIDDKR